MTASTSDVRKGFNITHGVSRGPQRTMVYGPGGVGKTTFAALAPEPVFLDLENGTRFMDVARVTREELACFEDVREFLRSDSIDPFSTVVIDGGSRVQAMINDFVLRTVPHESGKIVNSIEGYGYGKGYRHNLDAFANLLVDLDDVIARGKNVVLICHSTVAMAPNPAGDDFQRYEPDLQDTKNGSIKNAAIQWSDNVVFLGYDVVAHDGKGRGTGTRTVYTVELPTHIAKSRSGEGPIVLPFSNPQDGRLWDLLLKGNQS